MQHLVALNEAHSVGYAKEVNAADLRAHLLVDHGVSIKGLRTKGHLGVVHLLAHTVVAHPGLKELMNLPPEWGNK